MSEAHHDLGNEEASKARLQAFNAAQWLARLANSYSGQGGEIQLRWDGGRIVTPDLVPGLTLGLSLSTLVLQFDENGKPSPHPINLDDKSSTELEAWILVELLHRGVDRDIFSKALPYEAGGLMSGEEPKYSADELADELAKLTKTFEGAADVLLSAWRKLHPSRNGATSSDRVPDLVFWPQRMEMGYWVDDAGSSERRIKLAFAAGGSGEDAARFIVERDANRLIELPSSRVEKDAMSAGEVADYLADQVGAMGRSRHA